MADSTDAARSTAALNRYRRRKEGFGIAVEHASNLTTA
jgi:hypothetical protein